MSSFRGWLSRVSSAAGGARALVHSDLAHPLLLGAFPVLSLLAQNIGQIQIQAGLRSLVVSLLLAVLLLVLLAWVLGRRARGAIAASVVLVVFFTYGHLYDALKQIGLSGATLVRHRYLVPVALLGLAIGLIGLRKLKRTAQFALAMNLLGLALVVQPLLRLSGAALVSLALPGARSDQSRSCNLQTPDNIEAPDIYLIIMDAYARHDILQDLHRYDNQEFLRKLESIGFYVVRGGLSNYVYTELSLASMLNLDYVQQLAGSPDSHPGYRSALISLIQTSEVREQLECIGYHTVAFETGVFWTEWEDAEYFLSRSSGLINKLHLTGGLSRFELLVLRTTMARAGLDLLANLERAPASEAVDPNREHRDRILFVFDELDAAVNLPSPKVVFVHILSPHPPMVFGPDGEFVSQAEFETDPDINKGGRWMLQAYADQVNYLNQRLEEALRSIVQRSAAPPIVVLQGDHGWADRKPEDRLAILNTIYLPRGGASGLYPTMTPVNTFRYIFDTYFGADYGLLEDASYFSARESVYKFEPVENTWSADG